MVIGFWHEHFFPFSKDTCKLYFFKKFILCLSCIMFIYQLCAWCPHVPDEGFRTHITGVTQLRPTILELEAYCLGWADWSGTFLFPGTQHYDYKCMPSHWASDLFFSVLGRNLAPHACMVSWPSYPLCLYTDYWLS